MRRTLGLLALSLTMIGCNSGGNQPSGPSLSRLSPKATNRAVQVAEPDVQVKALTTPVYWHARGRDVQGNQFEGYLVVEGSPTVYLRTGYFEWHTKDAGGRYHFKGTYDPTSRVVRWSGYTIEQPVGAAGTAFYEATLSKDGFRFENGKWSGGPSIPGNLVSRAVRCRRGDRRQVDSAHQEGR
jgi:hypothetical protein